MADAATRTTDHDHRIWHVHQVGSGVLGGVLVTFGLLGFVNQLDFFSTSGGEVAGISSNGLLSTISVVVGAVLIGSAFAPRATSSWVASVVGVVFILAGFANLAVLETSANILAFEFPNVVFSLVSGIALLVLGLYGRSSRALDEDNPYRLKSEASAGGRPPPSATWRAASGSASRRSVVPSGGSAGAAEPSPARPPPPAAGRGHLPAAVRQPVKAARPAAATWWSSSTDPALTPTPPATAPSAVVSSTPPPKTTSLPAVVASMP